VSPEKSPIERWMVQRITAFNRSVASHKALFEQGSCTGDTRLLPLLLLLLLGYRWCRIKEHD